METKNIPSLPTTSSGPSISSSTPLPTTSTPLETTQLEANIALAQQNEGLKEFLAIKKPRATVKIWANDDAERREKVLNKYDAFLRG